MVVAPEAGSGQAHVSITDVAVAVMMHEDGRFLLAQRPPGKPYEGYWEFPGGKVERGERPTDALKRELLEELGIAVSTAYPWITRTFVYTHAHVRLHFFRVTRWDGVPHPKEGQVFQWQGPGRPTVAPLLPANAPVLRALALPHVYGISRAGAFGERVFLERLESALAGGLRLVQLREKEMAGAALETLGLEVAKRCRAKGAKLLVNGGVELARRIGAEGVHLSSASLALLDSRPDVDLCAASCHDRRELDLATRLGVDFVVLGSVRPTPTHPGIETLGWETFARLVEGSPLPVFALGGLDSRDLTTAWERGAHGIAMMRGAWGPD